MSELQTTVATICQALMDKLAAGDFNVEGRLPSERALSEHFSTTRITLREALGQLEAQGLIYREVRKGWFISPPRILYNPLQRSHFHAMVQEQGRSAQTEVLDANQLIASDKVCDRLGLPAGSRVYCIRRLRYIDSRAVLYVEHYLNPQFFPDIIATDLTQSLTDSIEQIGEVYSVIVTSSTSLSGWQKDYESRYRHRLAHLPQPRHWSRKVQPECISHAHDRGRTDTAFPSYCHPLGYCCGRDRYDAQSVHAGWNKQTPENSARTPKGKALRLSRGNPIQALRSFLEYRPCKGRLVANVRIKNGFHLTVKAGLPPASGIYRCLVITD